MDSNEMRSLEEKTRAIVAALSSLESETQRQKEMGDKLEQSKDAVLRLAADLSTTANKLGDAIELLRRSTLADDISRFDEKIDGVRGLSELARDDVKKAEALCQETAGIAAKAEAAVRHVDERIGGIEAICKELLGSIEAIGEASAQRDDDISKRIAGLETIIGRIDRNTQKGIGQERG